MSINTVDDFLANLGQPEVNLLKIDTQGFDLEVLRGAQQSLAAGRIGAVLVELNFSKLYCDQSAATDIIRFLADHRLQVVDFYEKIRAGAHAELVYGAVRTHSLKGGYQMMALQAIESWSLNHSRGN